jgi:mono/diheme cytochrome c family protein
MRQAFLSYSLIVIALLAACSPNDPGSTVKGTHFSAEEIAQGRVYYEQTCAACHGIDGQGQFPDAPLYPDVTGRYGAPPHNEIGHTWHHTDELLLRYIIEGGFSDPDTFYPMPKFGGLYDREQAAQIIAYIKTMWTEEQRIYQHHMTSEEEAIIAKSQP